MIKRTESESPAKKKRRTKSPRSKRRRMMLEKMEDRRLLAAAPVAVPLPTVTLPTFTGARNIGATQAFAYVESEGINQSGGNDSTVTADFVPLGTGAGQQDTIDISGDVGITINTPPITLPDGTIIPATFNADIDTYAFDLRAGDILDIATQGAAGEFTVQFDNGQFWFGIDDAQAAIANGYTSKSPLQTVGNAVYSQVVPEDGRYFLTIPPISVSGQYQVGLRVYRPVIESAPIGAQQVVFLDLDGAIVPRTILDDQTGIPQTGVFRIPSLQDSLPFLGLDNVNPAEVDRLIDLTIEEIERQYAFLGTDGNNGDYDRTGTPGDYGIMVLNSRDHIDPGDHPLVTRVLIGGPISILGLPAGVLGVSTTLDVGNFSMNDTVFTALDLVETVATSNPIANSSSVLEASADVIAFIVAHEIAHSLGMRHTEPGNNVDSIADAFIYTAVGPDGIYGTLDDEDANFIDDQFSIAEGIFGTNFVLNGLANTLATGTVGETISGRAFNDLNGDGVGTFDGGLGGVEIYADINSNGIQDGSDPTTVTASDGSFTLATPAGTFDVIALVPSQFIATTPTTLSSSGSLEFGFTKVIADITGTKFSDNNNNNRFDPGEPGIAGVYIYLDLDGDNRPDLGEPAAITAADGSYTIDFPGPGTYTIREVIGPGFIQTFPDNAEGEHSNVVFDGTALTQNYDFGNLPSRDFGDAPDTYRTTIAAAGPSHGITAGLSIGAIVDRDLDGQPTTTATGDDVNGRVGFDGSVEDDEDGARLLSPLGPGDSASVEVSLTNTSGSPAFLQAWMDFNLNGNFDDPGEQFATDLELGTGVHTLPVFVPATATVGTTYMRLRYSQTPGLGVGGDADTGEVEDYSFPILDAARVANNDEFSVSRNTQANQLDVLANDFQTVDNQLTIIGRDIGGTSGSVVIANDGKSVFYTPPTGFIGRDVFGYTVRDSFGRLSSATAVVNVTFQSAIPIALDDTFEIPEGSVNRALNVLDNDVASTAGGLVITSVTAGNQGGTITITGGGQSIRYTPLPGFNGTEQFTYSIQDAVGSVSSATVTVSLLPGSRADDLVEFSIGIFDTTNDRPVTNVQVGDLLKARVFVDDLRTVSFGDLEGVASGFLDLLYTDELVATVDTGLNPNFPFDIEFGPLFSGGGAFQQASAQVPGLLDEVGGVQPVQIPITSLQTHSGPAELFTVTFQAVSPGVAIFQGDPADNIVSETTIIGQDRALEVNELRFGRTELTIVPAQANFASAIDDSFPDGRDSNGDLILANASTPARLNVLANDNFGPTGTVSEFGLVTAPAFGNATINDNGTPGALNDDFIEYIADLNASGFERFTYVTVSADGIRSTAEVTIALGNAGADDIVAIDFALVNEDGSPNPTGTYSVGDKVGVQVIVEDLRSPLDATYVFAGFLDVMYGAGILTPSDTIPGDDFDFDVVFASDFNAQAAVGTGARAGIIDEFGTLLIQSIAESGNVDNPNLMATIFFDATRVGTTTVAGGPADASPFQDTLLFREDDPVPVDQIRYDTTRITVTGPEPEGLQNTARPADVNNDGDVSAIDALLVMNFLAAKDAEGEHLASGVFHDVSGEGNVTARDALMVINYLNRAQILGESELAVASPASPASSTTPSSQADAADQVLATLEASPITGDSSAGTSNVGAAVIALVDNSRDSDDDEDDDIVGLLADDVSGLWG